MLQMTTTPGIDGRPARTVLGIVSGEALADFEGLGRQAEQTLHDTRATAMAQMSVRAQKLGASAIVGVAFDVEALGPALKMVIATGTAVVL
ncbi:MAG: heavy metal-binding domain-containing protein [Planctomycetes bacterium]|nr:heavy metal-binding domain-containing protein [Planctomycetota bacterium]